MDTRFQELKGAITRADEELKRAQEKIVDLVKRYDKVQAQFPELTKVTKAANEHKLKILDAAVLGTATDADVKKARAGYDDAALREKETAELIDAVDRGRKQLESSIPGLQQSLQVAGMHFWSAVLDDIKVDVQKALGDRLARGYAAMCLAGFGSYEKLLNSLFPAPPHELSQALQGELEREFLK